MRAIDLIKKAMSVYSDMSASGWRISEQMVFNVLALIVSMLVLAGFLPDGVINDAQIAAIATGVMSVVGIVLRLRSKGGVTRLRDNAATDTQQLQDPHEPWRISE